MQCERRLTDAAFVIEECDDHGATSVVAACPKFPVCVCSGRGTAETTASRRDVGRS
jgi:hypothetical protein